MRQVMKTILLAGAMMFGLLHSVWAFSLAGPVGNGGDAWQVTTIGYGPPRDSVAPKNLGEEYRRNIPVNYYAYDANFLDYFGSNGVVAVDGSFAIMNSLTNVSSYSTTLSEFPLDSRHINYQAQALRLYDLKSFTLGVLVAQLGLADPVSYIWGLHNRYLVPNTVCPDGEEYLVVQRNFDFVSSSLNQLQYSPYVNDTLYSYQILEVCQNSPILAEAVPFSVDPLADIYSPVASLAIGRGGFYTGFTRDDVSGLRYMLRTNNINWESPAITALLTTITTNLTSQQLYPANTNAPSGAGTFDLSLLFSAARTNNPVTLQVLFPGLIVATSSNYFILATNATVVSYYTNYYGEPVGSPPHLKTSTNYTHPPQTIYVTTFANIVTNHYSSNTIATLQTITVAPQNGAPIGSPSKTNYSKPVTIIQTNVPSGDYYLLSPDLCPVNILYTLQTNVFATTNVITAASTNVVVTNTTTTYGYSQNIVTYFTNYIFVVNPVVCAQVASTAGLYQGIENVKFVKSSFDSLLGQFFQPITNNYTMVLVTNSQAKLQHFQRIVTTPDFLFSAADLAAGPGGIPVVPVYSINLNFDTANVLPGLAGPGTITPSTKITFDKVGPVYFNSFNDVMDGTPYFNATPAGDTNDLFYAVYFIWASYDGSTNAPVVYPNGTSIDNLANQILIQVAPASLANGAPGVAYPPTTFTATGGAFTQPYTWSATSLPNGLSVSSAGTLSGTPTQSGTFTFTLTLTDYLSRSVQWNYSLTIQ